MTNPIKNLRSKEAKSLVRGIALFLAVLFIITTTTANFAVAQTPQSTPPQIPNYNLPPDEQSKQNITIPDQPSNPGVPGTQPSNPTSTPSQPDYLPIAMAIIAVAVIAAGTLVWITSRRKRHQ